MRYHYMSPAESLHLVSSPISLLSLPRHQRRRSGGVGGRHCELTVLHHPPRGDSERLLCRWLCSDVDRDLDGYPRLSGRRRWTKRAPALASGPALAGRCRWYTRPGRGTMWAEMRNATLLSLPLCTFLPPQVPLLPVWRGSVRPWGRDSN